MKDDEIPLSEVAPILVIVLLTSLQGAALGLYAGLDRPWPGTGPFS